MIRVIITSFNEPNSTIRAVQSFLNQKIKDELKITVVDPFEEVGEKILNAIKDKRVEFALDSGEGKSYALNLLIEQYYSKNINDLLVFTDGDVYVGPNSLSEIISAFKDSKIGCVTGKPVPIDDRKNKYGYWSHLLFDGIDKTRQKLSRESKFFECSGYLFAIRNGVIQSFPLETSEDSIIPYLFWKKGYSIRYLQRAEVYVKNPSNWKDWLAQKIRNIKAHENLDNLAPDLPRTKSFFNEIKFGWSYLFTYPKSILEFFWTIQLYFARLYLYLKAFSELKKRRAYEDGWRGQATTNSTKTLD